MSRLNLVRSVISRLFGDSDRMVTDGGESGILPRRVHAKHEGGFVVFHIGMRINAWWKIHQWLPIVIIAPQMVRELRTDSDSGLLESLTTVGPGLRNIGFVQYWRSFEDLRQFARDNDYLHLETWDEYNRGKANSGGAVGIWHETYLVREGEYETVYNNMPPHAFGAAPTTDLVPATGQFKSASGRLGYTDGTDARCDTEESRQNEAN